MGEAIDYVKTDLMPDFDFDAFNHEYNDSEVEAGSVEAIDGAVVASTPVEPAAVVSEPEPVAAVAAVAATPIADAAAAANHASEEVDKW